MFSWENIWEEEREKRVEMGERRGRGEEGGGKNKICREEK
jgi:hypothetical protein